jgi:hypothetical protein
MGSQDESWVLKGDQSGAVLGRQEGKFGIKYDALTSNI